MCNVRRLILLPSLALLFSIGLSGNCIAYTLTETYGSRKGSISRNFTEGDTITLNCGESLVYSVTNNHLSGYDYYTFSFAHKVNGGYQSSGGCDVDYNNDCFSNSTTIIAKANAGSAGVYGRSVEFRQSTYPKSYYQFLTVNIRHNYVVQSETQPTCTAKGVKITKCSCGEIQTIEYGNPAGHILAPEIQEGGYFQEYCTVCSEIVRETPITYQVIFNGNNPDSGNMENETEVHTYGDKRKLPPNLYSRIGYTFNGWAYNGNSYADEEEVGNLTTVSDGIVTLEAIWKPNQYTIIYDSSGGSSVPNLAADYNSPIGPLPTSKRIGYTFGGWYTESGEQRITEDTLIPLEGATYYARWHANKYTVTFDITSGTKLLGKSWIEVIFDGLYGILPFPQKIDHVFQGWFTQNGEKLVDQATSSNEQKATQSEADQATPSDCQKATQSTAEKATSSDCQKATGSEAEKVTPEDSPKATRSEAEKADLSDSPKTTPSEADKVIADDNSKATRSNAEKSDSNHKLPAFRNKSGRSDGSEENSGTAKSNTIKADSPFIIYNLIDVSKDEDWGDLITKEIVCKTADDHTLFARWMFVASNNSNGTNTRPGLDGEIGTEDDNIYWNGEDGIPGTDDDRLIYPGEDGICGTEDDYYIDDQDNKIFAGQDSAFSTPDDYIDNGEGTNGRPGSDGLFNTEDDELWWNGKDNIPGNKDDKIIYPGEDETFGTEDDYYIDENGNKIFAGPDESFGTGDDFWITEDGRIVKPGPDHIFDTPDDYIDNLDGTHIRTGDDGILFTKDDQLWMNGSDDIPWTEDDYQPKGNAQVSSSNTSLAEQHGATPGKWLFTPVQNSWKFYYQEGGLAKNCWEYLYYSPTGKTDWYYFNEDGIMQTGFLQYKEDFYYLHELSDGTKGHMYTGWKQIDNEWYYFNTDGILYTDT